MSVLNWLLANPARLFWVAFAFVALLTKGGM